MSMFSDTTQVRHRQLGSASRGLLAGALRSGSLWVPATLAPEPEPERVPARTLQRRHRHVIAHELFRDILTRERKRADRFDQPFVLLLVEMNTVAQSSNAACDVAQQPFSVSTNVIEALTVAVGETAVLGWFVRGTVLGAIVPGICGSGSETLVRRELAWRLDAASVARLSIRSHVYSPNSTQPEESQPWPARHVPAHYGMKRGLDLAGSLTLLLILSPVFLLISVLLKLTSPGPILFRQARLGQRGKPFTMLKFRTMRVNADHALHHEFVTSFIRSSAQLDPAGRKALFKLTNDPHVTPLGRMLRKSSLDELPQLWNALRGDMSLVGPRPPLAYEVEQYRPWHWRRVLDAKPGVTGLWQVSGRSRTTFDEMVRLDLQYVRTCSLWTDIKILLATPRAVISGEGAG
jgi:lipopolysaccharide/colanic/teichoic acid biosynthesis glycosyltransferase